MIPKPATIFLSLLMLLASSSCERHGTDPWHGNGQGNPGGDDDGYLVKEATFKAVADTRSSLISDDGIWTVEWDEMETIGIWDGKKMETFTNVTAPGREGTFKGEVTVKDNPDDMFFTDYFYAVSPFPEEFTDEGNNITEYAFHLPICFVSPEEGRLGKGCNIGVAMVLAGLKGNLDFHNVLSFLRITVKDAEVTTLKMRMHGPIVGKVEINPISRLVQSGEKARKDSAWVVSFSGIGGQGVNEYYIPALPGSYLADLFISTGNDEGSPTLVYGDCAFSTSRMQVTDYRTITDPGSGNCRMVSSLGSDGSYVLISESGFDIIRLGHEGDGAVLSIEVPGKESLFTDIHISDLQLIPDGSGAYYVRYYDPAGIKADGQVFHNLFLSSSGGCLAPSRLDDPDTVPDITSLRKASATSYKIYLIEK